RPGWKDSRGPQVTHWHPGRGAGRFNQQLRWRCSLQCPSSASSQRWLHAGVALRARAAREDNNAEDRLDLEEAIAEAERVLQDNDKVEKIKAVLRRWSSTWVGVFKSGERFQLRKSAEDKPREVDPFREERRVEAKTARVRGRGQSNQKGLGRGFPQGTGDKLAPWAWRSCFARQPAAGRSNQQL
ncbi:unnamed protein product, partial [Effrenium voratum]